MHLFAKNKATGYNAIDKGLSKNEKPPTRRTSHGKNAHFSKTNENTIFNFTLNYISDSSDWALSASDECEVSCGAYDFMESDCLACWQTELMTSTSAYEDFCHRFDSLDCDNKFSFRKFQKKGMWIKIHQILFINLFVICQMF